MLFLDRPDHQRLRALVNKAFARSDGIVLGVAGRRNFDDTHVIERRLRRIEGRVAPHRREFRCADAVGVSCRLEVNGIAHGRQLAVAAGLAVAGPDHVENPFPGRSTGIQPTLDDSGVESVAILPPKSSSAAVESPEWESVDPIMPNR